MIAEIAKNVHFSFIYLRLKVEYIIVKHLIDDFISGQLSRGEKMLQKKDIEALRVLFSQYNYIMTTEKAASVPAKLKSKAKTSGISYRHCLLLFIQGEFLRKIFLNK